MEMRIHQPSKNAAARCFGGTAKLPTVQVFPDGRIVDLLAFEPLPSLARSSISIWISATCMARAKVFIRH